MNKQQIIECLKNWVMNELNDMNYKSAKEILEILITIDDLTF